jgi:hypothetical protein
MRKFILYSFVIFSAIFALSVFTQPGVSWLTAMLVSAVGTSVSLSALISFDYVRYCRTGATILDEA